MRCSFRIPAALLIVAVLAACSSQNHAIPPAPTAHPGGSNLSVEGFPAKFTEYPLPAGIVPDDITVGPDGAVWFANFTDFLVSPITAGQITGTGAVKLVTLPNTTENDRTAPFTSGGGAIASARGQLWTMAVEPFRMHDQFITSIDTNGNVTQISDTGTGCCAYPSPRMAVDRQGTVWVATCPDSCTSFSMLVLAFGAPGTPLPSVFVGNAANTYTPNGIAIGPDGNIYVTATYTGIDEPPFVPQEGFVFKITPSGTIAQRVPFPARSEPHGITAGPDGNLWIAESGANKIARMTTAGAITEFSVPTPDAVPLNITAGSDGALWFTEYSGNALGRITTDGTITEYPIPTPHVGPKGIVSCPSACDNAHGRIWFSEQAGRMGKFEF